MEKQKNFVAINYIQCQENYKNRFEQLFATRAHAIDRIPGFIDMQVLKPKKDDNEYLIVSFWENENAFLSWTKSPEFIEGHKRGFEDVALAKQRGEIPPMTSNFKIYEVIAR